MYKIQGGPVLRAGDRYLEPLNGPECKKRYKKTPNKHNKIGAVAKTRAAASRLVIDFMHCLLKKMKTYYRTRFSAAGPKYFKKGHDFRPEAFYALKTMVFANHSNTKKQIVYLYPKKSLNSRG